MHKMSESLYFWEAKSLCSAHALKTCKQAEAAPHPQTRISLNLLKPLEGVG